MAYKYTWWFLGLSVLIIIIVWNNLDAMDFHRLSHDWSTDAGGRSLDAAGLLGFIILWILAMWARSLRYQCLAALAGCRITIRDAFESVSLGRFFTLITPSTLLGGQPISYFRLATRYPIRIAAGVVTVSTWLDIAFFFITTPIVVWRVVFILPFEQRYFTLTALTLIIYGLILGAFWLALSRWSGNCIRLAARMWAFIVPFWQEETLRRTFSHAAEHLRTFVDAFKAGDRQAWYAFAMTAVAIICPYVGIWWLLSAMGCSMSFLESMGNQLAINFMALVFSPGAGSGPSEFMFIQMFDRWEGEPSVIHLAIFMSASYWSYILVGLLVWLSWRPNGTLLTLEVESSIPGAPHSLTVRVEDECDISRYWMGIVDAGGEYSMFLPKGRTYRWQLFGPSGLLVDGRVLGSPLIKRVFIGSPTIVGIPR